MFEEKDESENPLSEKQCSSAQSYKQEILAVEEQLVKHTQNCVRAAHHKKIIQAALTTRKPPKGLTPTLRVTAMGQTPQLTNKIDAILNECALKVCTTLTEHYTQIITTNKTTNELSEKLKKTESMAKGTNNEEQIHTAAAGAKQKAKQEGLSLAYELLQRNSKKRPAPTTPDTATEPPPAKKTALEGLLLNYLEQNKVNTNPNPNPNNLTTTHPTAERNLQRQGNSKKRPRRQRQRQRQRPPLKYRKLNRLKTKIYHKRIYKTKHRKLLNNII